MTECPETARKCRLHPPCETHGRPRIASQLLTTAAVFSKLQHVSFRTHLFSLPRPPVRPSEWLVDPVSSFHLSTSTRRWSARYRFHSTINKQMDPPAGCNQLSAARRRVKRWFGQPASESPADRPRRLASALHRPSCLHTRCRFDRC